MLRKLRSPLCLLLTALLVLCSISIVSAESAPIKVACVGDGNTAGFGLTDPTSESYPVLLQEDLGSKYEVTNFGVNDATILKNGLNQTNPAYNKLSGYQYTEMFQQSVDYQPDVVVIMLGSNDVKPENIDKADQIQKDLEDLIDKYQRLASRPKVMVATPYMAFKTGLNGITQDNIASKVVPAVKAAAKDMGCYLVDMQTVTKDLGHGFADNLHPDAATNLKLAQSFSDKITSSDFKALPTRNFDIAIRIDDQLVASDVAPSNVDGRVLVPLRAIFEALGAQVTYDASTQTVTGTRFGNVISLVIGSTTATVNGEAKTLDVPPMIISDRTMVPTRFVAESLGATVAWDGDGQTVNVSTNLALNKPAVADNVQSANLNGEDVSAANVCDGKVYTRWSTDFTEPHYIYVDLGSVQDISRVTILWESSYATDYTVQVSDSTPDKWVDVYHNTKGVGGYDEIKFDPVKARYVQVLCNTRHTEWGFSILELGVHI